MLREYTVKDEAGLHARPLSVMVNHVAQYDVPIHIAYKDKKVPLHSMMMAMSLGVPHAETFTIEIDAEDAEAIFKSLETIMKQHDLID